jgi:hypothetical protein
MDTSGTPDEFFIFVSEASFWTRHNFHLTGSFVSGGFAAAKPDAVPTGTVTLYAPGQEAPRGEALRDAYERGTLDYLQFTANPGYFGWPSPFAAEIATDYRVEWDAEVCRRHVDPLLPSRLSAIYAFGDHATCEEVAAKHHWQLGEVARFRLVPDPLNRIARVNMEIVSLARLAYRRGTWTAEKLDEMRRAYWLGGESLALELPVDGVSFERVESGVIWEYLIEGRLERVV